MNCNGSSPVLAGTKQLTPRLAARIGDLMERHNKGLNVTLPHEYEPLLTTWAATANITIDELVTQLLDDALKIKRG